MPFPSHAARIRAKAMEHQIDIVGAQTHPQFLSIGEPERRVAYLKRAAGGSRKPGLIWLGGFMSNMRSTKATFVDQYAAREKRACLLFDYSAHGESAPGSRSPWRSFGPNPPARKS
jgi:pimeloyl-ACP methyl ester carboxylesterase